MGGSQTMNFVKTFSSKVSHYNIMVGVTMGVKLVTEDINN